MKLRKIIESFKEGVKQTYFTLRKKVLVVWTKISEERRKNFFSFFHNSFNYLQNAVLFSIPIMIIFQKITLKNYLLNVICIWILLPFLEHYYIWLREKWKDDLVEDFDNLRKI